MGSQNKGETGPPPIHRVRPPRLDGRCGGSKGHYRKQKHKCVQLVAGDPAKAAVVKEIFQLHYRENLGGRRIAQRLNSRGILSPRGKTWSQRQVESLYENPVYCGVSLGRKVKQSIYYSHGQNHPEGPPSWTRKPRRPASTPHASCARPRTGCGRSSRYYTDRD